MLKFHGKNCLDPGCQCKDKSQETEKEQYTRKDSMMSRTILLTNPENGERSDSFVYNGVDAKIK